MPDPRSAVDWCHSKWLVCKNKESGRECECPTIPPAASSWIIALIYCIVPDLGSRSSKAATLTSAIPPSPRSFNPAPQLTPCSTCAPGWIQSGRLIKAIVLMYAALRMGYRVPVGNVFPSSGRIVPFETELGKCPIYRLSNNGLVFPYKC